MRIGRMNRRHTVGWGLGMGNVGKEEDTIYNPIYFELPSISYLTDLNECGINGFDYIRQSTYVPNYGTIIILLKILFCNVKLWAH